MSRYKPPYGVVPNLMIDLFDWLKNSDEHILIKSCVFHYEFEFIHPSSVKSSVKSSVNTEDKILEYIKQNPKITIRELSELLDLTTRAIEKQISNLKKENKLQRVGSARKGYWEIIDEI